MTRYRNFEELFQYCRYSANPVGRLVLGLCGYRDAAAPRLSDATCTALQLANFWQDVIVDLEKGSRLSSSRRARKTRYPVEGSVRAQLRRSVPRSDERFHRRCAGAVPGGASAWPDRSDRRLSIDLELFSRGGLKILEKSSSRIMTSCARVPDFESGARGRCWAPITRRAFHRACMSADSITVEESYQWCVERRAQAGQEFLLLVPAALATAARSYVRHLRLHALLRRSERR